jgi:hypothetical protein
MVNKQMAKALAAEAQRAQRKAKTQFFLCALCASAAKFCWGFHFFKRFPYNFHYANTLKTHFDGRIWVEMWSL